MGKDTFGIGFTHVEIQQIQHRINHLFLSRVCLHACGIGVPTTPPLLQLGHTQGAGEVSCKLWLG